MNEKTAARFTISRDVTIDDLPDDLVQALVRRALSQGDNRFNIFLEGDKVCFHHEAFDGQYEAAPRFSLLDAARERLTGDDDELEASAAALEAAAKVLREALRRRAE
ncbi:hypothetical protein [Burkholderia gladioli]|uniref:hypothetical protein n=1 Tax=Burkholderia gladioli TaxID=28095 RepID=UPI001640B62A|nr:hypothetical protein [Burkholderia gladioli]